ncbi:MAG TPA: hypothetical protein VF283_10050 [Bryobacteraceae bacterium]
MEFLRNQGTDNDALTDDSSFTIAGPGVSTVPEPSTFGHAFCCISRSGAAAKSP